MNCTDYKYFSLLDAPQRFCTSPTITCAECALRWSHLWRLKTPTTRLIVQSANNRETSKICSTGRLWGFPANTSSWEHTCQGYTGYFREPRWISTGLPEISRVNMTGIWKAISQFVCNKHVELWSAILDFQIHRLFSACQFRHCISCGWFVPISQWTSVVSPSRVLETYVWYVIE